ncbi:unnamed protein product, partial [Mesorhabditis spiculigera]
MDSFRTLSDGDAALKMPSTSRTRCLTERGRRRNETAIGEELGDMPEMAEIEDDVIVDVAEEGELDDEDDDDFSDYEDEEMEDEAETSETRQGQA